MKKISYNHEVVYWTDSDQSNNGMFNKCILHIYDALVMLDMPALPNFAFLGGTTDNFECSLTETLPTIKSNS